MASSSLPASAQEPIHLHLTAHTSRERFTAIGLVVATDDGWTIVWNGGVPDDKLCLFTPNDPDGGRKFVPWLVRHFPHWLNVRARRP